METTDTILKILLKDFSVSHTITSLAEKACLSRVGAWKIIKKLEEKNLILLSQIGKGKTSVSTIQLNYGSIITSKTLGLLLSKEAVENERWLDTFRELENKVDFLILYGSILASPKEANDIDIIAVAKKGRLNDINEIILKLQKTQLKKIHALNFTIQEFKAEIKNNNGAFIDGILKGVVLYGQDSFIRFIQEVR